MGDLDLIKNAANTNEHQLLEGNNIYGGLYCRHWGNSDEFQQEIIDYAKEIGYLKG